MKKLIATFVAALSLAACGSQEAINSEQPKVLASAPATYSKLTIAPGQSVTAIVLRVKAPPSSFPRLSDGTFGGSNYIPEEGWRVVVISSEVIATETQPLKGCILEVEGMTNVEVLDACDGEAREVRDVVVGME